MGPGWLAVALLAAAPALFEAVHHAAALAGGLAGPAALAAGAALAAWRDAPARSDPGHVPVAAQRPHAAGEHHDEAGDADPDVLGRHPGDQQSDADQESEGRLEDSAPVMHSRVACAHAAGEPRVLGIERLLDLLELALLVLRERHVASPLP